MIIQADFSGSSDFRLGKKCVKLFFPILRQRIRLFRVDPGGGIKIGVLSG